MARWHTALTVIVLVWFLGSGVLCLAKARQEVKLTVYPQKAPAEVGKFTLLPPESALIDGDAVPLYEKAARSLPDKAGDDRIRTWLEMPIDQLPLDQVEQALSKYLDSLKSVSRAARCRQCNWPEWTPGTMNPNLDGCRRLAFVIRLWARLEIAGDRYEGAALALQTGFGMGRHLGQGPTIIDMLTAVAVGAVTCGEVEQWIQRKDAPNQYLALGSLPKPFVNIEKAIENEKKVALARSDGKLSNEEIESRLKPSYDQARLVVRRVDVHIAALQCVEAVRAYAAGHGGQLPGTLAEITEVSVPKDPVSGELFHYTRTGATALLESAIPAGGNERNRIRYEIAVEG